MAKSPWLYKRLTVAANARGQQRGKCFVTILTSEYSRHAANAGIWLETRSRTSSCCTYEGEMIEEHKGQEHSPRGLPDGIESEESLSGADVGSLLFTRPLTEKDRTQAVQTFSHPVWIGGCSLRLHPHRAATSENAAYTVFTHSSRCSSSHICRFSTKLCPKVLAPLHSHALISALYLVC